MKVRVDFHTHILPGVDDGSKTVEGSLVLLQKEKEQGIDTVVLTPHFYGQSDNPQKFLNRRQQAYEKLMTAAEGKQLPQLKLGAEVYYFSGIADWEGLRDFAIEGTEYVLVEMPFTKWNDRMYRDLDGIYRNTGLVPVIAHIERYINIFTARKVMERLGEINVLVQANAEFFTTVGSRSLALKLLKNGDINILGSDCHNLTDRAPNLAAAQKVIISSLGEEYIEQVTLTEDRIMSATK